MTFTAGSGFLDDDDPDSADGPPCVCWCDCQRATTRPDETCARCWDDRRRDDD
jgi:hypothetical protein